MQMESVQNTTEQYDYEQYKKLGGIINEKDYKNALLRAKNKKNINQSTMAQAENMAKVAGIALTDRELALYAVLREDANPDPKERYHHSQMTDQRLFAEVLRMLGDTESLRKLISRYPNIFPQRAAAAI